MAAHRHEPDHIIPIQHGGEATEDNLALAWMRCNRYKGPNVGSFDPETGALVPRTPPGDLTFRGLGVVLAVPSR